MCFSWPKIICYTQFSKRLICTFSQIDHLYKLLQKEKSKTSMTRFIFRFLSCVITSKYQAELSDLAVSPAAMNLYEHTHCRIQSPADVAAAFSYDMVHIE